MGGTPVCSFPQQNWKQNFVLARVCLFVLQVFFSPHCPEMFFFVYNSRDFFFLKKEVVNSVNEKGEDCYFCVHDDWWSECRKVVQCFMRWFLKRDCRRLFDEKIKDRRNRSKKYKQKKDKRGNTPTYHHPKSPLFQKFFEN